MIPAGKGAVFFFHVLLPALVTILLLLILCGINFFRFDSGMRFEHNVAGGVLIFLGGLTWIAREYFPRYDYPDWQDKLWLSLLVPVGVTLVFIAWVAGQNEGLSFWQALTGYLSYL